MCSIEAKKIVIHFRKIPTSPCSSLNSGVIRRSRVIKFRYRPFSSKHVAGNFFRIIECYLINK